MKLPQLTGSEKITFSFWYYVRSYDTAVWDWLDVKVLDADSGALLGYALRDAGKPGYGYGTYWNGGWQHVTMDLTAYAGKKVRLWFGDWQDGWGVQTAGYIDDVKVTIHE